MPIPLPSPITTDPIPPITYDAIWIRSMIIRAPLPTEPVVVNIEVVPYNSASGSILLDKRQNIVINDLFTACATNQSLAMGIQGVFVAVNDLVTSQGLFQQ